MDEQFEVATGSITGRHHLGCGNLLSGKNNQDAFQVVSSGCCLVATVHDGCGSGAHSEVGAQIGARLVVNAIWQSLARGELAACADKEAVSYFLEQVLRQVLLRLGQTARGMIAHTGLSACNLAEGFARVIQDYFLFTTVGVLVTPADTVIFSIGDGVYALNGEVFEIGPYEGNAPPYLAYALLPAAFAMAADLLRFQILRIVPTAQVRSLLIGTDGVKDLLRAESSCLPGKTRPVGPLAQLWLDDRFFAGRDGNLITAFLRQVNSEVVKFAEEDGVCNLKRHPGLLDDDTTVIVLRRRVASCLRIEAGRQGAGA